MTVCALDLPVLEEIPAVHRTLCICVYTLKRKKYHLPYSKAFVCFVKFKTERMTRTKNEQRVISSRAINNILEIQL